MSRQLKIQKSIRKPPTPPTNRHEGRETPRPTRGELLEESLDLADEELRFPEGDKIKEKMLDELEEREALFFAHQTGRME